MISVHLPVVVLCVALAVNYVTACSGLEKGDTTGYSKIFHGVINANEVYTSVQIDPHLLGSRVSGVNVHVCSTTGSSAVEVTYTAGKLHLRRLVTTDHPGTLDFVIKVYYLPVIPDSKFLDEGIIGVTREEYK